MVREMGKEIIRSRGKECITISEDTGELKIINCRGTDIVVPKSAEIKKVKVQNSNLRRLRIQVATGTPTPKIKWRNSKAKFFDLRY